ncbi:hypothetical protein BGX27_002968 [Mortierella sp. AM989]|nr:hypothetical protein BGX27_002968 [Mortierella sp. AM989]
MDACSEADLDGVLKVLDATLVHPRPTLNSMSLQLPESMPFSGPTIINKGKERHASYDESHAQYNSIGSGTVIQAQDNDVLFASGVGVGSSSSHQRSAAHSRNRTAIPKDELPSEENTNPWMDSDPEPFHGPGPAAVHRFNIFQPRQRVDSEGSQNQHCSFFQIASHAHEQEHQPHMPWVDGRALTSALLAVCFRRDGYESEEAEAIEESKAVPIVNEILKYDCMLTAQSLGHAALGVAYSRSSGSIKRSYKRRMRRLEAQQQDQASVPSSNRSESVAQEAGREETSEYYVNTGVMDLLMERIGPREWLKLIKCYLQRQEFEDLGIILELCPFKGQQLEAKGKSLDKGCRFQGLLESSDEMSQRRLQARELICREAGICSVGTRLSQFNGRGIGQSSYNVSSTLHESSRMLFTGSGTRFTNSYMLPRGGFRGIGGNTSGHSSTVGNGGQGVESEESFNGTEDDSNQSTEANNPFDPLQNQWRPPTDINEIEGTGIGSGSGSRNGVENGDGDMEEDDGDDLIPEQFDAQDSSLAFGGIGTSTTSSSRPGPGIVGIAIQVQAPEHIMNSLLKMGFRFFSISDLSISDNHHPLAFQFRQQEKLNRLLIEFCMAPNSESLSSVEPGHHTDKKRRVRERRKRRDEHRYDVADREYYNLAAEKFLYPAASHPARGATSISALPSQVPASGERQQPCAYTSAIETTLATSLDHDQLPSETVSKIAPAQGSSALSPSNRLQFVLPSMHLGESFESIAAAAAEADLPDAGESSRQSPDISFTAAFGQLQYHRSGLAKSMPLPIRASMVDARNLIGMNLAASMENEENAASTYQKMLTETTKRRIREHLSSEYIDLMTVGICLYQACFHHKELVLSVLLEHRLLIAQDALSGAVQVAASVGWKRGLEILLMEHGDMEAEIDPVVTTTSDYVHNATSVKWDHATAVPLNPAKSRITRGASQGSPRRARSTTAGGLEGFVSRGLRRHRSDGGRLNRSNSGSVGNRRDGIDGSLRRASSQTFDGTRHASSDFTDFRAPESTSTMPTLTPPNLGLIIPNTRSSSLRIKISSLLPNLSAPFSSANSTASLKSHKKQKSGQQRHQEGRIRGLTPFNVIQQASQAQKTQPPVLLLSTSGLYSLPSVMMQRKNRNAVIALMAATTRNDPTLVSWLIASFADIKIVHIMQALMVACNRGYIRVVQVLVGGSVADQTDAKTQNDTSPRMLFRQWLALQYERILEMALLTSAHHGPKYESEKDSDPTQQRFDSFPFVFLMETSPIFRHYHQILNTLSSSQFMFQRRRRSRKSQSAAASETFYNIQNVNPSNSTAGPSPLRLHRRQQQQQQQTENSSSKPLCQPQTPHVHPQTPQETKIEIIRIMLEPLLETFGSISFRKALDRMPRDCWWPLDHDVRLMVDQEARKAMVAIVIAMKRQQKSQREQQRQQQQQQQYQSKPENITEEVGNTEQIRNERWHKIRRWAALKYKKNTETVKVGCEEKVGYIESATMTKSIFGRLGFANTSA